MCGRFTQQRPSSELARIFEAEDLADDPGDRFNVAPTDEASVIVQRDERRAVVRYRWGLVPGWTDDRRFASRAFNARAETVAASPLFRDAFRRRRCLVPVDSFYEWQRSGGVRQPLRIHDPGAGILALAGLWTGRRDEASGEWLRTFTIVTTRPNGFMAPIHDRMPVIVPAVQWPRWLGTSTDPAELRALLEPRDDLDLDAYPVPTLVNNARNDGPALIERAHPAPPPGTGSTPDAGASSSPGSEAELGLSG